MVFYFIKRETVFHFCDVKTATFKTKTTESYKSKMDDGISVFMLSKQSAKSQRDSEFIQKLMKKEN